MTPIRLAYTPDEAAGVAGVDRRVIMRAIHAGQLKAKKVGARYLIPSAALNEWIDSLPDA